MGRTLALQSALRCRGVLTVEVVLLGAHFPEDEGVDGLEVRRVGHEGEMNALAASSGAIERSPCENGGSLRKGTTRRIVPQVVYAVQSAPGLR